MAVVDALPAGPASAVLPVKPRLRGWLHLIFFEASLCLGTLLIVTVPADHRAAACVYAAAVSALFGSSALYHRGQWRAVISRVLERLDHAMIFVLIGGSATPLFLICLPPSVGVPVLIAFGVALAAALVTHVVWIDAPESLVTATYIALGCLAGVALPGVWTHAGVAAFVLIVAGGALYIIGAVLFNALPSGPVADRVRLPRGVALLRVRGRRAALRRDRGAHSLTR